MNHLHVRKSLDELLAQRGWRGRWLDTAGGPILTASFPRNPAAAGLAAVIDPEAGYVIVYVGLVVVMSTVTGLVFGAFAS